MDPNNPVIQLCLEGMQAEAQGRLADARSLFMQAWDARQDDYDACVAAHYAARHQEKPEEVLFWNRLALEHASSVEGERMRGFYPSLYLNLGWSYEQLDDPVQAKVYYELAVTCLQNLPAGSYRDMVQDGASRGLKRTGGEAPRSGSG